MIRTNEKHPKKKKKPTDIEDYKKGKKKQEFKARIEREKKRERSSSSKGALASTPTSFSRLGLWSESIEDPWHFIGGTKDSVIVSYTPVPLEIQKDLGEVA